MTTPTTERAAGTIYDLGYQHYTGERLGRCFRHVRELRGITEVLRPRSAGREDEVALRLIRDACIGLPDFALQETDVDVDINCHLASSQ